MLKGMMIKVDLGMMVKEIYFGATASVTREKLVTKSARGTRKCNC